MKNKTVLVTGAASGIGAAVIHHAIREQADRVIALDLDQQGLKRLCDQPLGQTELVTLALDLTDHQLVADKLLPQVEQFGGIDTVVISHGVADENQITDDDIWDKVMSVNLHATQRLLSLLEGHMVDKGSIVVVSSILGLVGKLSNTAYCSSKHGLLGLVKGLALDLARRKIRVNAVLPSWVDTPMLRREVQKQADLTGISEKDMFRRIKKRIPLRSLVSAEDVADCVLFFASDQARMITAQSLVMDGGDGCGL